MPCFHPIPARREYGITKAIPGLGPQDIKANVKLYPGRESANLSIPCGRCIGCKTRRAQEWAVRAVHETRYHHRSIFATLTYDEKHLPKDRQLQPRDLQLFLKKLRKAAATGRPHIVGDRLRYLACGEYGDQTLRPHYHAILFGLSFDDERVATAKLMQSPTLSSLWGKGTVNYGEVTAASAAYVAGYTTKSMGRVHCDPNGVVMQPPFLRVSTRPGIGATYADSFAHDLRSGSLVVDGEPRPIPRYYAKRLEMADPFLAEEAQENAAQRGRERLARDPLGSTEDRLVAGEIIMQRRQELTRSHSL